MSKIITKEVTKEVMVQFGVPTIIDGIAIIAAGYLTLLIHMMLRKLKENMMMYQDLRMFS